MFKGSDDSVAWASPLSVQQSRLSHSSWAMLPGGIHAARLWKMPGGAFSLYSKIRVWSAPPWKATPVRLSCITTGKEASRTSHTVRMSQCLWTLSPFTDWHLPSETCNFSGNSLSASCSALEIIYSQRKQKQKRKSSNFLPHLTLGIFLIQQQHCYIKHSPQWEVQGQLMNFLLVLPMYCTKLVFLYIYI